MALPTPVRFLPYGEAGKHPHIVVDGAPLAATRLTLSHWPNNRTPPALRRDTSTATVFAYLDDAASHVQVPYVTNNHFDEDGLFSAFVLCDPDLAQAHRGLLIDGSLAGDFGIVRNRDAARLCFAIESLTDPAVSNLPAGTFTTPDRPAALYGAMLQMLPELLARLPAYRSAWELQDAHLAESRALLADASVTLEEDRELDLAIVHIPEELALRTARRYLRPEAAAVHPFAINTATSASRLLKIQGQRYEFQYRYESWVQLASRRVPLRVKLDPLVRRLNELETSGAEWTCDDVSNEVAPVLTLGGNAPSSIDVRTFRTELGHALRTGTVAWDPYDWPRSDWPKTA